MNALENRLRRHEGRPNEANEHRTATRGDVLRAYERGPASTAASPRLPNRIPWPVTAWNALAGWRGRPALGLSAASLLLVCGVLATWSFVAGPAPLVYAELIEPLMDAKSGRFDAVIRVHGEETMRQESFFDGDRVRINVKREGRHHSRILDTMADLSLDLDHLEKRAVLRRAFPWMDEEQRKKEQATIAKYGGGLFGGFRAALDPANHQDTKPGHTLKAVEKTLPDGRVVRGFRGTRDGDDGYVEVWADDKTGEPTEFVMHVPAWPDGQESVLTDFEFDEAVDPALFSMKAPEGYAFEDRTSDPEPESDADQPAG